MPYFKLVGRLALADRKIVDENGLEISGDLGKQSFALQVVNEISDASFDSNQTLAYCASYSEAYGSLQYEQHIGNQLFFNQRSASTPASLKTELEKWMRDYGDARCVGIGAVTNGTKSSRSAYFIYAYYDRDTQKSMIKANNRLILVPFDDNYKQVLLAQLPDTVVDAVCGDIEGSVWFLGHYADFVKRERKGSPKTLE